MQTGQGGNKTKDVITNITFMVRDSPSVQTVSSSLSGVKFDGSSVDCVLPADSHNHSWANVTPGLGTAEHLPVKGYIYIYVFCLYR